MKAQSFGCTVVPKEIVEDEATVVGVLLVHRAEGMQLFDLMRLYEAYPVEQRFGVRTGNGTAIMLFAQVDNAMAARKLAVSLAESVKRIFGMQLPLVTKDSCLEVRQALAV